MRIVAMAPSGLRRTYYDLCDTVDNHRRAARQFINWCWTRPIHDVISAQSKLGWVHVLDTDGGVLQ